MKKMTLIILFVLSTLTCVAQSLFFDELNKNSWISLSNITDSIIQSSNVIPLAKLNFPKDSLKEDVTIWNFNEGILTITFYDYKLKTESMVASCQYESNAENGILAIIQNGKRMEFKVGIVSTGNNVLLTKKRGASAPLKNYH